MNQEQCDRCGQLSGTLVTLHQLRLCDSPEGPSCYRVGQAGLAVAEALSILDHDSVANTAVLCDRLAGMWAAQRHAAIDQSDPEGAGT